MLNELITKEKKVLKLENRIIKKFKKMHNFDKNQLFFDVFVKKF